jgi:hypothetical protein
MFSSEPISKTSSYPVDGAILCEVVRTMPARGGTERLEIQLRHVASPDGVSIFEVSGKQLVQPGDQ